MKRYSEAGKNLISTIGALLVLLALAFSASRNEMRKKDHVPPSPAEARSGYAVLLPAK